MVGITSWSRHLMRLSNCSIIIFLGLLNILKGKFLKRRRSGLCDFWSLLLHHT
jgi:hypothetical protein